MTLSLYTFYCDTLDDKGVLKRGPFIKGKTGEKKFYETVLL